MELYCSYFDEDACRYKDGKYCVYKKRDSLDMIPFKTASICGLFIDKIKFHTKFEWLMLKKLEEKDK